MIWFLLPMEAVQRVQFIEIKIMLLMEMQKYEQVDAGIYGKILLNKINLLVILKNSVVIFKKQIGNRQQLQH